MDVKRLARFDAPGHHSEGRSAGYRRSRGAGWDYLHCVVDDHSRLAYVELHGRDTEETNIGASNARSRSLPSTASRRLTR